MWSWAFAVWLHKCLFPANAKPELTKWCARTVWSDHQVLTAHTVLYVKNRQQNGPSCIYFFCSLYISALWLCLSLGPFSGLKIISNHLSHIQYVPSKGVSPSFIDLSLSFSPLSLSDSVNLHTKNVDPTAEGQLRPANISVHMCLHALPDTLIAKVQGRALISGNHGSALTVPEPDNGQNQFLPCQKFAVSQSSWSGRDCSSLSPAHHSTNNA